MGVSRTELSMREVRRVFKNAHVMQTRERDVGEEEKGAWPDSGQIL